MDQQELFEDFELVYHARKDIGWKLDRVLFYLDLYKKLNDHVFRTYDLAILYFKNKEPDLASLILKEMNIKHATEMSKLHVDDDYHALDVATLMHKFMQDQKDIDQDQIPFKVFHFEVWEEAFSKKDFKRIKFFLLGLEEKEKRVLKGIFVA